MIMPRGQPLLLPVRPAFITFSLLLALLLDMLPLGRVVWTPDWLMLLLVFWGMHQPQRVGMGLAFLLGLAIDVQQAALLGQHALVYAALVFAAQAAARRVLWFGSVSQALQLAPLFFAAHALELALRLVAGGVFPGLEVAIAPLLETLLWPLASWLLLAPQRRPPDQDDNRPL
ncbi:rod shape-determining protein MreD [Melaminivora alkalimesophila]|uniref:Rod shape-determining protein MreD n=1 Tax=Melaminivora alkalimesophila TaxID=1165852 RepID=A0A317RC76_9BURK|nr:rod shape-determining protein MreD [Melaminivora alkalimesophila]PWW47062.1 rod shape-determining protein MreD [Melaminivora alkalimesophila]